MLAWDLERGVVVIPKSVHPDRIKENFDVFDIDLSDEEKQEIATLDQHNSYFNGLLTPQTMKALGNMKFDYKN